MREAYRLQKSELQKELREKEIFLALFIIYIGNEIPSYKNVFEKFETLLPRLLKVVNQ